VCLSDAHVRLSGTHVARCMQLTTANVPPVQWQEEAQLAALVVTAAVSGLGAQGLLRRAAPLARVATMVRLSLSLSFKSVSLHHSPHQSLSVRHPR
jgi:hypothetical protein